MRFIVIVIAIVLAVSFVVRQCSPKASLPKLPESSRPSAPLVAPLPPPPVPEPPPPPPPQSCMVYRFADRMPPDVSKLAASLGVQVATDDDSRSVTLRGPEPDISRAYQAIAALDMGPESCAVEAWAVYVDRSLVKGWDLVAALQSVAGADLGLRIAPGRATLNLTGDEIAAALNVLADGVAVDVIQRPSMALLHAKPALVESTQEVPVPTLSVSGNGVSQSGVTYRKVGLSLAVKPYFLGRDRVRLEITQSNGLVGPSVDIGNGLQAPVFETQSVSSTVEISIGQAVVLGGVTSQRVTKTKGILRDKVETKTGSLFVVISTASMVPKALPVDQWALPAPAGEPFGSGVLPAKPAMDQEFPLLPPLLD